MLLLQCLNRLKGKGLIADYRMAGAGYPVPNIALLTLLGARPDLDFVSVERELREVFSGRIAFA